MQSDATNVKTAYVRLPTNAKPAPGQIHDRLTAFIRSSASSFERRPSSFFAGLSVAIMSYDSSLVSG